MAFNPLVISCCLMHLLFNLVWLEPGRIKAHGRAQAINSQPLCVRSVDKWGKLKEIHYWSDRKFQISARVVSFLLLTTFFHLCTPCDIPQLLHSHWSVHSALWLVNGFDTETHTNTRKQTKHAASLKAIGHQSSNEPLPILFYLLPVCACWVLWLKLNVCLPALSVSRPICRSACSSSSVFSLSGLSNHKAALPPPCMNPPPPPVFTLTLSLLLAGLLTKIAPPPFPPFYLFIFKHLHSLFCHPTRFQLPSFTSPLSASLWSGTVHVCTHLPRVVRCVLHGRRWRVGCSLSKKRMRMTFCEEVI